MLGHYRRLCVLRRLGRGTEAHNLEVACFEPALTRLREAADFDAAAVEARLAEESRRVEEAALLAECLLPFLQGSAPPPRREAVETGEAPLEPAAPAPQPNLHRGRPAAGNVAAFIDDMLAQSPSRRR